MELSDPAPMDEQAPLAVDEVLDGPPPNLQDQLFAALVQQLLEPPADALTEAQPDAVTEADGHLVAVADALDAAADRLVELAAALGACPDCWGEHRRCPTCGGRGLPGSRRPDPDAFAWYVRPLLVRLQRSRPPRPGGREQTQSERKNVAHQPA